MRAFAFASAALLAAAVRAYPLDGYEQTGIRRLEGNRLADEGVVRTDKNGIIDMDGNRPAHASV